MYTVQQAASRPGFINLKNVIHILLCAMALSGCLEKEASLVIGSEQYAFQPGSHMEPNALIGSMTPINHVRLGSPLSPQSPPVSWSQGRFLELIEIVATDEIRLGASVKNVTFAVSCDDIAFGPQDVEMSFYRVGEHEDTTMRLETIVRIDAQAGYLEKRVVGYYPPQAIVDVGDLSSKLSVETVLTLAEQGGGKEFRELKSNDCRVQGSLVGNEWSIMYEAPFTKRSTDQARLRITLDATTGAQLPTDP